jgi:hypothetical protein
MFASSFLPSSLRYAVTSRQEIGFRFAKNRFELMLMQRFSEDENFEIGERNRDQTT